MLQDRLHPLKHYCLLSIAAVCKVKQSDTDRSIDFHWWNTLIEYTPNLIHGIGKTNHLYIIYGKHADIYLKKHMFGNCKLHVADKSNTADDIISDIDLRFC